MEKKNMCPPPLPGSVPPPLPGTTVPPVLPKVKEEMEAKEREAKLKAEEEARRKAAEAEARMKAEIEAKVRAEMEAKAKAEAEAKRKAEEEARRKAEAEAKRKAEEARRKAEVEAKAEEARKKAEAEAKAKVEEARKKAEAEAKAKAEEARKKAEAEAKAKRMVTPEMVINRIIKDLTESICWTEKVKTGIFSSETRVHRYLKCSRPLTSFEVVVICSGEAGEAQDPAEYDTKRLFIPANSKVDSCTAVFHRIRDLTKKYHEPFLKEKGASYPYFDHFDWNNIEHVKLICPQFDGMYKTGEEANHGCSAGPYYPILKLPDTKLGK